VDGDQRFCEWAVGVAVDEDLGGEECAPVVWVCGCGDGECHLAAVAGVELDGLWFA
jgi:hypothetical protein